MNVLLLTQVLPYPPDSGPKIKTWNLIKHLAVNHNVTLVSFTRGDQSAEVRQLKQVCDQVIAVPIRRSLAQDGWAMARSLISGFPWLILRDDRKSMRKAIDGLAVDANFDIVHADQLNMAQYALRVATGCKVLDAHNALWLLYRRLWETLPRGLAKLIWGREWRLLRRYEGRICTEFDGVLAVSLKDRAALEEVMGSAGRIQVVPITVDPEEVLPVQRQAGADHILSMGTMFWQPNVDGVAWFLKYVFPLIRAENPDAKFDILGDRPPRELVRMANQQPGVTVTGYVDDPTPWLTQAGAMVVPLLAGGGMRVKILQALAQEVPIISTTIGCEGIDAESERHLLIADTPDEFARATVRLLANPELGKALGREGRELVLARYNARTGLEKIDEAYLAWSGMEKAVAGDAPDAAIL